MKTIRVILTVIAFATICICQIEVDLTLINRTSIRVTVPEDAFQMVYNQRMLDLSYTNNGPSSHKKAKKEDNVRVALCAFESETEYEQFRQLWDTDSPAPAQEQASLTADLTADLFEKCLITADYLGIWGEYAERFTENMVKYGLLGRHSADIVSTLVFSTRNLPQEIFQGLLYPFLRQTGFKYWRTHRSAGQNILEIESIDDWPAQINEEYKGPTLATRMRTVLYSELGPPGTQERERNEAVFMWLLLNIGGSSVDIHYTIDISSEDTTGLSQTIKQFTKENEKGARVYVEGVTLEIDYRKGSFSLLPALQCVLNLSHLELTIMPFYMICNSVLSSLMREVSSCKSLKALTIIGQRLESGVITILVETLPIIEQLCFPCKILDATAIHGLKKCVGLEVLKIWGELQPSTAVQALVSCLPSLKELSIWCQFLDPVAAEAFQACTQLESLKMNGDPQPSTAVQALVSCLPSLKELSIWCQFLDPAAAEAFQACTKLESLKIEKEIQETFFCLVKLLEALPSLQNLEIKIDIADLFLADALRKCPNLRTLNLSVMEYTPGFLAHYLQDPLPSITSLKLYNINELNNYSEEYNNYSEEDDKAVDNASRMGISGIYI
ncbi:hypothetical protein NECID01_2118 [Nematocida sp. AWRm77]|nr:hypothetical protein NECID01_2118 [Nematocida sp. AWRm77]